jgi:hypothetical protein
MNVIRKSILSALLALLAIGVVIFSLPLGTAAAQTQTPTTPQSPEVKAARIARLEKAYQAERKALETQAKNLDRADKLADRIQTVIDTAKSKGVDTSKLVAALAAFNAKVSDAKTLHAKAEGILSTHAGFTANGKVIDPAQARDTLTAAHQALKDARQSLGGSFKELINFVKEWRKDHKPVQNKP